MKQDIFDTFHAVGLIPVVKIDDPDQAVPLAQALKSGGIRCVEITFRTAAAAESIRRVATQMPDVLVGAGTVTSCEQVDQAIAAGAQFAVSPGYQEEVIEHCLERGITVIPGVCTPSEVDAAIAKGLRVLKFFPVEAYGGVKAIKALSGPYKDIRWIPTGGINADNISDYLAVPSVLACGGSWLVDDQLLAAGEYEEIVRHVKDTVRRIMGYSLVHIGVNAKDAQDAENIATFFAQVFSIPYRTGNSDFAGDIVEVMHGNGLGKNGHIAIGVNDLERAIVYLRQTGYTLDESTSKFNEHGKRIAIYFHAEFGGFAVHLVQKK